MVQNVSAFGIKVALRANVTYPVPIVLTQFADETDPFDIPSIAIAETAKGVNGDLVTWSSANPVNITLAMIAGSDDDEAMSLLFQANNPSGLATPSGDIIVLTAIYPDTSVVVASGGVPLEFMPGKSVATAGRLKSNTYTFSFEQIVQTPAVAA